MNDIAKETKLLAIDLDETLLRSDNTVSKYTKNVIHAAQQRGLDIVLATGRMYQTAAPVGKALGLGNVPMVLFSGGLVQELELGHKIWERTIPAAVVHDVFTIGAYHNLHMQSYVDDHLYCHHENEQSRYYARQTGAVAEFLGDDLYTFDGDANKLIIIDNPEQIDTVIAVLAPKLHNHVTLVRSQANFLEILPHGVSKGLALTALVKSKGIDLSQVVAFGNADNDISMLSITGASVAVANGTAAVKQVATYQCGHHNEDGVAHWIEEHILV